MTFPNRLKFRGSNKKWQLFLNHLSIQVPINIELDISKDRSKFNEDLMKYLFFNITTCFLERKSYESIIRKTGNGFVNLWVTRLSFFILKIQPTQKNLTFQRESISKMTWHFSFDNLREKYSSNWLTYNTFSHKNLKVL